MEPVLTNQELDDIYAAANGAPLADGGIDNISLTARREYDERILKFWREAGRNMEPSFEALVAGALGRRHSMQATDAKLVRPEPDQPQAPWADQADTTEITPLMLGAQEIVIAIGTPLARAFIGRCSGMRPGDLDPLAAMPLTALERRLLAPFALAIGAAAARALPRAPAIELCMTSAEVIWERKPAGQTWMEIGLEATGIDGISIGMFGPANVLAPESKGGASALANHLERTHVEVAAELGVFRMTVDELTRLTRGSLILLDTTVGDTLPVTIGGVPKLLGEPLVSRGNLALRIERRVDTREAR